LAARRSASNVIGVRSAAGSCAVLESVHQINVVVSACRCARCSSCIFVLGAFVAIDTVRSSALT
jgi:hypothetical protein